MDLDSLAHEVDSDFEVKVPVLRCMYNVIYQMQEWIRRTALQVAAET